MQFTKHIWKHIGEKSNNCNQCSFASVFAYNLRVHLKTHSGEKPNKMQPLWLYIRPGRQFEDAFRDTQKTKKQTNVTSDMTTPETTIWKNCTNATSEAIPEKSQTNAASAIMHLLGQVIWGCIWKHIMQRSQIRLKTHTGEKPNNCNQCDCASSRGDVLRIHLKKTQWRQVSQVPRMWLCIP